MGRTVGDELGAGSEQNSDNCPCSLLAPAAAGVLFSFLSPLRESAGVHIHSHRLTLLGCAHYTAHGQLTPRGLSTEEAQGCTCTHFSVYHLPASL